MAVLGKRVVQEQIAAVDPQVAVPNACWWKSTTLLASSNARCATTPTGAGVVFVMVMSLRRTSDTRIDIARHFFFVS
jgi:hypothetical protein